MKKFSILLVILVMLGLAAPAYGGVNQRSWRFVQCRFRMLHQPTGPAGAAPLPGFDEREIKLTIRCATNHYPVPGGYAKALSVAECESHLYPGAVSPTGAYLGIFQLGRGEFAANLPALYRHRWNVKPSIFNARSNILAAVRYARGGWGPWSCA